MGSDVETLALLVFRHPQTDQEIYDLEGDESDHCRHHDGDLPRPLLELALARRLAAGLHWCHQGHAPVTLGQPYGRDRVGRRARRQSQLCAAVAGVPQLAEHQSSG